MQKTHSNNALHQVSQVESKLGIRLPEKLLNSFDENGFNLSEHVDFVPPVKSEINKEDIWPIDSFLPIHDFKDLESFGGEGWAIDDSFEDEITMPTKLIVFASSAGKFWCLDYRSNTQKPSVVFVYSDYEGEAREVYLAQDYSSFVNSLTKAFHEWS
jgi:hypothetical protein